VSRYEIPKDTEVSTTTAGGEEFRFSKPVDVVDERIDAALALLADDPASPVKRSRKAKEE
jgi:hypothetical protein